MRIVNPKYSKSKCEHKKMVKAKINEKIKPEMHHK